jgi:hypothetical protein
MVGRKSPDYVMRNKILRWSAKAIFCVAVLLMLTGAVLSFGIIEKSLVLNGPFRVVINSETSHLLAIDDLRSDIALGKLLSTSGDSPNNLNASTLHAFANGEELNQPHSPHELIHNQGGGAFSHWNESLIFSLPHGVENTTTTQLRLSFPIYLNPKLLVWAFIAGLVSGGWLLWRQYRREPSIYIKWVSNGLLVLGYLLQWVLLASLFAAIFFLGSMVVGWFSGYLLPNTALFRWWPELNALAMNEPFFGHVILCVAMVGACAAWLSVFVGNHDYFYVNLEMRLARGFQRYGLFFVLGRRHLVGSS